MGHYITAIGHLRESDNLLAVQLDDATLATTLILAHYEVTSSLVMLSNGSYGMEKLQRWDYICWAPRRSLFNEAWQLVRHLLVEHYLRFTFDRIVGLLL